MIRIIDSDGHIVEPRALWEEYTEPAYRERVIQVRPQRSGDRRILDQWRAPARRRRFGCRFDDSRRISQPRAGALGYLG
jgi:hypothetical protein